MMFRGWQANTTGEDVGANLLAHGAFNVVAEKADISKGREFPEWTWEAAVDTDEDMVDVVATMAWYNDRTDEQLEAIKRGFADLLLAHPRRTT